MSISEAKQLLKQLQRLLEKQLELARRSKISEVENLVEQTGELAKKIGEAGIFESPEIKELRARIETLYEQLCLSLSAYKGIINDELGQVRRGRKIINAYRLNAR